MVSHVNKGTGSVLARVTGSIAFVALARCCYMVVKDPGDESLAKRHFKEADRRKDSERNRIPLRKTSMSRGEGFLRQAQACCRFATKTPNPE